MKILHLSHTSLPDWRIEKAALTAKKAGHIIAFGGTQPHSYVKSIFDNIYSIDWTSASQLGIFPYWYYLKKQIKKVLQDYNPDIIHAHNIVCAKIISEFRIPFIYDNHEYASVYAKNQSERRIKKNNSSFQTLATIKDLVRRKIVSTMLINRWTKWEKEIVSTVPTITVSNAIASDLKKLDNAKKIFVVPNFPLHDEVALIKKLKHHIKLSCVYVGSESSKYLVSYRNIEGLTDLFQYNRIGNLVIIGISRKSSNKVLFKKFLPRDDMFQEMIDHSIGLIPWKKHWSHKYVNPNKAYEYAHAGLFVLCTSDLTEIINTLNNNCDTFDDYDSLVSKLEYYQNNLEELYKKRMNLYEFAKQNLIWEKYEQNIIDAYKIC